MSDNNCIFCKIAAGEIPSKTIYEDDKFRVILDLGPATKGHALILPKNHYANLYELPEETAGDVMKIAKKMATVMTEKLGCQGFNLMQMLSSLGLTDRSLLNINDCMVNQKETTQMR